MFETQEISSMKKSLIAVAALRLSLPGVASAQMFAAPVTPSAVTVSGIVDASVSKLSVDNNSLTLLSGGRNSSNRLIFKGIEDLGGGLGAAFWMEAGFQTDDGTAPIFADPQPAARLDRDRPRFVGFAQRHPGPAPSAVR
jgi:predicted porin